MMMATPVAIRKIRENVHNACVERTEIPTEETDFMPIKLVHNGSNVIQDRQADVINHLTRV